MTGGDLYGEVFDRKCVCCRRTRGSGVEGNDGKTSSLNENVDWYGLPESALEVSDPVPVVLLFFRPLQLSRML
jgi:hypothetical protein